MQCLYVQQDAIKALCVALSHPFAVWDIPALRAVRTLRNKSIGHPVSGKQTDKQFPHTFMIQLTMTPGSFEIHSRGEGGTRLTKVELAKLVTQQETEVREVLQKVAVKMEEQEIQRRKQFRSEKLVEVLEPTGYAMQKVFEAAWNPEHFELGHVMLPMISKYLDEFTAALKRRDIEVRAYHGIDDALRKLKYPMARLTATFAQEERTDPELVEIFADYVARNLIL